MAGASVTARYLRGIGLIAREQDGALQYYRFNAHGDVVQRCDGWGNPLKSYEYDAFGVEENREKLDSNPFRYCGEYTDSELGCVYLRARYYNPRIGRFGSEDPARDGLNWYTYCAGNPILMVDPNGMVGTAVKKTARSLGNIAKGFYDGAIRRHTAVSEDPNLYNTVNYWTFGLPDAVQGTIDSATARYVAKETDPSLFNEANYWTFGAAGMAKGAIMPEDPFSEQHLLDSFGTAALLMPAINAGSKALTRHTAKSSVTWGTWSDLETGTAKSLGAWLEKDTKIITNRSGDKIFLSQDGLRRARFDLNNPFPHSNPHAHIEELVNGRWVKSGPIYPVDVPHK